jgi:hypothetical protein
MTRQHKLAISIGGGIIAAILGYVYFWQILELLFIAAIAAIIANGIWCYVFKEQPFFQTPAWMLSLVNRFQGKQHESHS